MRVTDATGLPLDWRLAAVAVAVALGGFMRGFVGFGGALVSVPVLSLVFGPHVAVASVGVMGIPSIFQLLPDAVRHSERAIVVPVAVAIFLAAPFGSWLLVSIAPGIMKVVISALVMVMVAMLARGWKLASDVGMPTLLAAGVIGGLVQGSAGIGGPPVVAIALSRPGAATQQRGNVLALMTAVALSSVLPLAYYGLFTRQALLLGGLMFPIYFASTVIGSRYFSRGGQAHYRRAALGTLAAVGLGTLVASLRAYVG